MKQQTFSDLEYSRRRTKTKRERFLDEMNRLVPWEDWVGRIRPHYYRGRRGRRPKDPEVMLRMYLMQTWFGLSAEGTEEAVSDSYAMRRFLGINFIDEQVPDASTLLRFRRLLEKQGLAAAFSAELRERIGAAGLILHEGSVVEAAVTALPGHRA